MSLQDRLLELIQPIVAERGLELFDLLYAGGTLTVLVQGSAAGATGEGAGTGVDIDAVAKLSRAISRALDEADPISSTYSLEVSTPGLERPLRTLAHYEGAIGELVSVKTTADFDGPRRVKGELLAATADAVALRVGDDPGAEPVTIPFDAIDKARTVFEWGAEPKKGSSKGGSSKAGPGKAGTSKKAKRSTGPSATATSGAPPDPASKPNSASKKVTSS